MKQTSYLTCRFVGRVNLPSCLSSHSMHSEVRSSLWGRIIPAWTAQQEISLHGNPAHWCFCNCTMTGTPFIKQAYILCSDFLFSPISFLAKCRSQLTQLISQFSHGSWPAVWKRCSEVPSAFLLVSVGLFPLPGPLSPSPFPSWFILLTSLFQSLRGLCCEVFLHTVQSSAYHAWYTNTN